MENFSTLRSMKIYAEYCRCILNDDRKSQLSNDYVKLLYKKLSQTHELQSSKWNNKVVAGDSETGLVAISLSSKCLGRIKLINNQAAVIFNYQRNEMEKLYVNKLMPKLYSDHHDDFLRVFLTYENKKVNTDNRLLIGKKK